MLAQPPQAHKPTPLPAAWAEPQTQEGGPAPPLSLPLTAWPQVSAAAGQRAPRMNFNAARSMASKSKTSPWRKFSMALSTEGGG